MAPVSPSSTRTLAPGDVVVSLADIVDKLGGKLSPSEINDLMRAIISKRKSEVRPGGLITADLMNQVLAELAELQVRVAKLEGGGGHGGNATTITSVLPTGDKHIGDRIHIIGSGFNDPSGNNVTIDSVQVEPMFGADRDRELIVTVPNLNVPTTGRKVTVLVSNLNGTDTMDFQVFPSIPTLPQGQLFVSFMAGPSGKLNAPGSYTFKYQVRGIVNLPERYSLEASTTTGWETDIVNDAGVVITDPKLDLIAAQPPDGTTAQVFVRVTIPDPPGAQTAQLRLTVKSIRNVALVGISAGETLTVGAQGPNPEPIAIQFEEIAATNSNTQPNPSFVNGVVKIPAGAGKYRLALNAKGYTPAVGYTRRIEPLPDSKWTASFRRTSSLMEESFTPQAGTMETFFLFLDAASGAGATELVVRIAADANANDKGHINQPVAVL